MAFKLPTTTRKRWILGIAAFLLLCLVYFSAPWVHGIWYGWFFKHIVGIIYWVLALATLLWLAVRVNEKKTSKARGIGLALLLIITSVVMSSASSAYMMKTRENETNVVQIDHLPESTGVRWLPLEVAENCALNRMRDSKYELGDFDPIEVDGELDWVSPMVPHGATNTLFQSTGGIVIVKPDCSMQTVPKAFKYGEGMAITDNLQRQLLHKHYLVDIPEVYYILHGKDDVLGVAPYISYPPNFPVRIPTWGGVFIIHPDGQIEDLSVSKAKADPRLAGQRIFPESLARTIAESWAYRNGIFNKWFIHDDETVIPKIADTHNQMPYLLPTNEGPQWTITFEPRGKTFGILHMMYINAHTGEVSIYTPDQSLLGVNRAAQYVKAALNTINWNNYVAYEPRPIVHGGKLYWQHSVTALATIDKKQKKTAVSVTTLTDADSQNVLVFCRPQELQEFLDSKYAGGEPGSPCVQQATQNNGANQPPQGGNPSPVPQQPTAPPTGTDIGKMTDGQLYDKMGELARKDKANAELQQQIADELRRRHQAPVPTPSR